MAHPFVAAGLRLSGAQLVCYNARRRQDNNNKIGRNA
jgi:hypothetical protein